MNVIVYTQLMHDCLIIGGGVIGLSLAYELATRLRRVCVLERAEPGRAASWAGAGMLPPGSHLSADPVEVFCHWSNDLHVDWAARLRAETGIDTGYRHSGAIYVARQETAAAQLIATAARARQEGISFDELSPGDVAQLEPALNTAGLLAAFHARDECQLRNPWHMQALEAACLKRGVQIFAHTSVNQIQRDGETIVGVQTSGGEFRAEQYCIAGGAWSAEIAAGLGVKLSLKPIRGQIALLRTAQPLLKHIVNEGPRYLVPREDGRVLVGSTMEDVGFDTSTTSEAIAELLQFAHDLAPQLAEATLEMQWAGLRPASADGQPYLGRLPGTNNGFIAAGHTRGGLHLAPATAVAMAQIMSDEEPTVDLSPFRVNR